MIDQAIREGRHSAQSQTVCGLCRQWVPAIFHIETGGGQGMAGTLRMCRECARKRGIKDAA